MNIEIKLKTEKKVTVDFLEFGYFGSDDTILTVDWGGVPVRAGRYIWERSPD